MENESPDLLHDFETELRLQRVSSGTRFANYIIDVIGYYIFILLVILPMLPSNPRASDTLDTLTRQDPSAVLMRYLVFISLFILYYTLLEGATKGKTLGKLITRTRVVKEDGSPIGWKDALLRSLCRMVPFEPFSAFGGFPWHDKWTRTTVVKQLN